MKSNKIVLTPDQTQATHDFLDFLTNADRFMVIEGPAGTGKSFLIQHLLETFVSQYKAYCLFLDIQPKEFDIYITATTNKAVAVIDDFLGHIPQAKIQTIYSLLGLRVNNDRKTGKTTLEFNPNSQFTPAVNKQALVIIDEASFISEELDQIIHTMADQKDLKVIYIGDPFQLAPVGQSFSALDTVQCRKAQLREVVRNAGQILKVGTDFRYAVETGRFKSIQYDGTNVIHTLGPEFQREVEASFQDPSWDFRKSKILGWTNARVQQYNAHIRKLLKYPDLFEVGETVITNEYIRGNNNYNRSVDSEVVITRINHDTEILYDVEGYLVELDHAHVGFMPKNFSDTKRVLKNLYAAKDFKKYFEIKETWLDLRAVYASSIHKAQGSTYETVFIDLTDIGKNWNAQDVARLLYVAITRASKRVVCYGFLPDRYC